jgi:hypothetical protein
MTARGMSYDEFKTQLRASFRERGVVDKLKTQVHARCCSSPTCCPRLLPAEIGIFHPVCGTSGPDQPGPGAADQAAGRSARGQLAAAAQPRSAGSERARRRFPARGAISSPEQDGGLTAMPPRFSLTIFHVGGGMHRAGSLTRFPSSCPKAVAAWVLLQRSPHAPTSSRRWGCLRPFSVGEARRKRCRRGKSSHCWSGWSRRCGQPTARPRLRARSRQSHRRQGE